MHELMVVGCAFGSLSIDSERARLSRQRIAREPKSGHETIAVFDLPSSLRYPLHQVFPGDDGIADVTDLRRVFMAIKDRVSDPSVERGTW